MNNNKRACPLKSAGRRRGFALLTVIFMMLVFSVLGVGVISLIFSGSRLAVNEYNSSQAFYIAEAGKNYAMQKLNSYTDWTQGMGFPISKGFSGGNFTVTTTNPSRDSITLTSTGVVTIDGSAYVRTIRANVKAGGWPKPFKYAIFWDNTGGSVNNTLNLGALWGLLTINVQGDVLAKGRVYVSSDSSVTNGTVYANAAASPPQVTIAGGATVQSWEATNDLPPFPLIDYSYYDGLIASFESYIPASGGSTTTWNGGTRTVNGVSQFRRLTAYNGAVIRGSGVVAVRESITLRDGVIVSPEGGSIVFVCRGDVTVGGGDVQLKRIPNSSAYGVILITQNGTINFINTTMKAYHILAMTQNDIDLTLAPDILDNSLLYSQSNSNTISFTSVGSFEGIVISRGQLNLYAGRITGVLYNDSTAGTLAWLGLGSYLHGALVSRVFDLDTIIGAVWRPASSAWDLSYLPELPRGVTPEGVEVSRWEEVY